MNSYTDNPEQIHISSYKNLVQGSDAAVVRERFDNLYERMSEFIIEERLTEKVCISVANLEQVLVAYFDDINRIKSFHDIELINTVKIHSYEAFWLLPAKDSPTI